MTDFELEQLDYDKRTQVQKYADYTTAPPPYIDLARTISKLFFFPE